MSRRNNNQQPQTPVFDDTGPSTTQTPYIVPTAAGVQLVSILSTGDQADIRTDRPGPRASRGAWSEYRTASAPSTTATAP
jgi:hypothetical protein